MFSKHCYRLFESIQTYLYFWTILLTREQTRVFLGKKSWTYECYIYWINVYMGFAFIKINQTVYLQQVHLLYNYTYIYYIIYYVSLYLLYTYTYIFYTYTIFIKA